MHAGGAKRHVNQQIVFLINLLYCYYSVFTFILFWLTKISMKVEASRCFPYALLYVFYPDIFIFFSKTKNWSKRGGHQSFQPTLWLSLVVEVDSVVWKLWPVFLSILSRVYFPQQSAGRYHTCVSFLTFPLYIYTSWPGELNTA